MQRCRQTPAEDHCFSYILLLAAIDMFLREANSYNRALALRNSRLLTNKLANADENITSLAEVKMAATAANRSFSNCYLSLALANLAPLFGFWTSIFCQWCPWKWPVLRRSRKWQRKGDGWVSRQNTRSVMKSQLVFQLFNKLCTHSFIHSAA